jgi:hypothetical protein
LLGEKRSRRQRWASGGLAKKIAIGEKKNDGDVELKW